MEQSIQEWIKWNLWMTAFKKFHLVHSWVLYPIYYISYIIYYIFVDILHKTEKLILVPHFFSIKDHILSLLNSNSESTIFNILQWLWYSQYFLNVTFLANSRRNEQISRTCIFPAFKCCFNKLACVFSSTF